MKIEQNKIDDLNLELALTVTPEDYVESKKKRLSEYRKKAEIKGFRKGMVPMSLVEKMYGRMHSLIQSTTLSLKVLTTISRRTTFAFLASRFQARSTSLTSGRMARSSTSSLMLLLTLRFHSSLQMLTRFLTIQSL